MTDGKVTANLPNIGAEAHLDDCMPVHELHAGVECRLFLVIQIKRVALLPLEVLQPVADQVAIFAT